MTKDVLLSEDYFEDKKTKFSKRLYNFVHRRKYSYLIYAFILPVILNYLVYLSMGIHPFGTGSVLVLDLNGQYVYFYEALRNAVYGETSLLYSFCRTLGGEFLGIYAYYVASPFSYIVCLFPQERILEALLCIFLLKSGISGVTMSYYLTKISDRVNKTSAVTFSLLYAMCSYAIVQQHNSMWIDCLMWLPLLALGIEELIRNAKYKLFVSMLALCLLSNFYIGYMCCIFTCVYFFYYYFSRNENGRNNPMNEKHHFRNSFIRIAGFSLLAIGISMVIVASAYYSLQFGKNTFSNPDFSFSIRFDLIDFFTKFLVGSYDTVRPEGLPFVYCGILTLFCVPVYFMSKKFPVREKVWSGIILVFFLLSFSINTLDIIWHGFQKPNWLNYRYSFMLCFLLVTMAYKGMGEIRKASGKVVAAIGAILVLFIAVAQKFDYHSYVERISGTVEFDQPLKELECIWISLFFVIVTAVVLGAAIRTKYRQNMSLIICIVVCVELFANAIINCVEFGDDVIYSSYDSYHTFVDSVRPICDELLESDTSFYRFEKNCHRKYCDNMALNIRGITNSTSTLNKSTIEFLAKIGYASKSHWSKYLGGTPVNDSLIGMKYIIASEDDYITDYYELTDIESITYNNKEYFVYENPNALSLAFAVDDRLESLSTKSDSPMLMLNSLVSAMNGYDEVRELFVPVEYTQTESNLKITAQTSTYITYKPVNTDQDAMIYLNFTAAEDGEVYFYLPSNYPREVKVTVNGKSLGNFCASETTRIFPLGSFSSGQDVTVTLTLDADVLYPVPDVPYLFTIDMDAVNEEFAKLASHQYEIDEWNSTHFSGTINTENDNQLILTTLPYDSGWKIKVDGKEVETQETLDALISFRIDTAGDHTVTMTYSPTCFTLGLTITILSLLLFIVIIVFEKQIKIAFAAIVGKKTDEAPADDTVTVPEDHMTAPRLPDKIPADTGGEALDGDSVRQTDGIENIRKE